MWLKPSIRIGQGGAKITAAAIRLADSIEREEERECAGEKDHGGEVTPLNYTAKLV